MVVKVSAYWGLLFPFIHFHPWVSFITMLLNIEQYNTPYEIKPIVGTCLLHYSGSITDLNYSYNDSHKNRIQLFWRLLRPYQLAWIKKASSLTNKKKLVFFHEGTSGPTSKKFTSMGPLLFTSDPCQVASDKGSGLNEYFIISTTSIFRELPVSTNLAKRLQSDFNKSLFPFACS